MISRYSNNFRILRRLHSLPQYTVPVKQTQLTKLKVKERWSLQTRPFCSTFVFRTDKTAEESETVDDKPDEPVIKKMPNSLLDLLGARKRTKGFPPFYKMALLTRKIYVPGITINPVEKFLLGNFNNKRGVHPSRIAFQKWEKGERDQALAKMTDLLEKLQTSGKETQTYKRVEYFLVIFRFAQIIESIVGDMATEYIKKVDDLCSTGIREHNDPTLAFVFWLTLFKSAHEQNNERSARFFHQHPEIMDVLLSEVQQYAKEYSKLNEKNLKAIYKTMPEVFSLGDIDAFCTKLMAVLPSLEPFNINKLLCFKALALWNAGYYSKGMTNMAIVAETLLKNFDDEKFKVELGTVLVVTLGEMIQTIVAEELQPVHEFLDVMCEKLSVTYKVPLYAYLYWIFLDAAGHPKADTLLLQYPDIPNIRHPKFERCLTHADMTNESKNYFVSEYLKSFSSFQLTEEVFVPQPEEKKAATEEEKVVYPPHVAKEMIDIRILEALSKRNLSEAVQIINSDRLPSDETMLMLINTLKESKAYDHLEELKSSLPLQTNMSDAVYETILNMRLRVNHALWQTAKYGEAIEGVLRLHEVVFEEEYYIQFAMFDKLLTTIKRFVRLYLEESLANEQDIGFDEVKAHGLKMSELYEDFSICTLFWEAHFFSGNFKDQTTAEEFLKENPKVARHLDIDHLLARAVRYQNEGIFRKLIEVSLRYDLEDYDKTRAFEGLLVFQCERGKFTSATETMTTARSLDINLGADAMQHYIQLTEDLKNKGTGGTSLFAKVFDAFKRK